MVARLKRMIAGLLLVAFMAIILTGCWDNREIDMLFLVTGIALDVSEEPEKIDIAVQIGDTKQGEKGSEGANTGENTSIFLETKSKTIMGGITELNRDSNNKLIMHHNQIRLFGIALAEQGVKKHIDFFLRDQQARLEVPMAVVEGRADELLKAKLEQEAISGIFLGGMFQDLAAISVKYRVRLIDFVSRLLDETTSAVMPIIKVVGDDEKHEIKLEGMAVFKGDKMIGRINNDEIMGYIWAYGNVKKCNVEFEDKSNIVVFRINKLNCKREVFLRTDGGVRVDLSVEALINVNELRGFAGVKAKELIPYLNKIAQDKIAERITECFNTARELNADIFGFGTSVYRKYPKEWKGMKDKWEEIFPDIELNVNVKTRIPSPGQIVQSLEMEGSKQ